MNPHRRPGHKVYSQNSTCYRNTRSERSKKFCWLLCMTSVARKTLKQNLRMKREGEKIPMKLCLKIIYDPVLILWRSRDILRMSYRLLSPDINDEYINLSTAEVLRFEKRSKCQDTNLIERRLQRYQKTISIKRPCLSYNKVYEKQKQRGDENIPAEEILKTNLPSKSSGHLY